MSRYQQHPNFISRVSLMIILMTCSRNINLIHLIMRNYLWCEIVLHLNRFIPKPKGAICLIFKIKQKVSNELNLIFRCFFILKEKYQMNWIRSADRISISRSNIRSADGITISRSNIRSVDRITISRSNIWSADRILRSHDATGGVTMKTIKLQHNKPNNNNSNNFIHFEKNCILLVYLPLTKQFLSQISEWLCPRTFFQIFCLISHSKSTSCRVAYTPV